MWKVKNYLKAVICKLELERNVAGLHDGLNFGMVEIRWDARPYPVIRLVAMNSDGEPVFEHRLLLSELKRH